MPFVTCWGWGNDTTCDLYFNPLTPEWLRQNFSLQYPYNFNPISDENKENISLGIISWFNTKFSEVTCESYGWEWGEWKILYVS